MQSTIDSVDLQMLSAYGFNKLPALVRTELLASGRLGGKVSKHTKLVCGVGFNDAHYLVDRYIDKVKVRCPAYSAWVNMLKRCYSKKYQSMQPTYTGCTVSHVWHSFMVFRAWWLQCYSDGYVLDKDLLYPNNKVYGPDTCLYVPTWLNSFTTTSNSSRGELPLGVGLSKQQRTRPYIAQCCDGRGKLVYLGMYATPEAAHAAWLQYKLGMVDSMRVQLEGILPGLTEKVRTKIMSLR